MKNIFLIFRKDIRGLMKNFLALVVAGGLCFLPALYAWFNIYANWDPYANTGNIDIIVVNLDQGMMKEDGTTTNMGDSLVESLKEKDSIHWVFLDTEEEAIEGIESGACYAAIVIGEDFTDSMYHGVAENVADPCIQYLVNGKKNAVATKITDSAVSSVQASVNKAFVQVLAEKLFTGTNLLAEDLESDDAIDQFIKKLEQVSASLSNYEQMVDQFVNGNTNVSDLAITTETDLSNAQEKMEEGEEKLESVEQNLLRTRQSFANFKSTVDTSFAQVESAIAQLKRDVESAKLEQDATVLANDLQTITQDAIAITGAVDDMQALVDTIRGSLTEEQLTKIENAIADMKEIAGTIKGMASDYVGAQLSDKVEAVQDTLTLYSNLVADLSDLFQNEIAPQMTQMVDSMVLTLNAAEELLNSLGEATGTVGTMFADMGCTIDSLNMNLVELQGILNSTKAKIDRVLGELGDASEDEKLEIILNFMMGNPKQLGEFFAEPVQVESHYIYEIKNYGSGVAPFYTTLAIWVGMTILVSLLKVHANEEGLVNIKKSQLYFGRYLLFFVMSQIQTLIIVLGDLFLLKIQCVHPMLFWLGAAMTSFTFSLLIYSLTLAFGDIGKAFAVVIMVVQIAGSGGTYPIEALPKFFQEIYIFFPFPYAINGLRECIGGTYKADFGIYMLKLGIFCVAALVIGLVVRIPFIGLNHYIEERMEDTEMM